MVNFDDTVTPTMPLTVHHVGGADAELRHCVSGNVGGHAEIAARGVGETARSKRAAPSNMSCNSRPLRQHFDSLAPPRSPKPSDSGQCPVVDQVADCRRFVGGQPHHRADVGDLLLHVRRGHCRRRWPHRIRQRRPSSPRWPPMPTIAALPTAPSANCRLMPFNRSSTPFMARLNGQCPRRWWRIVKRFRPLCHQSPLVAVLRPCGFASGAPRATCQRCHR